MQIDWASHTDTGRVREHNEDFALVRSDAGFGVLADGMGGHQAGEVASRMAVTTYEKTVTTPADSLSPMSGGDSVPSTIKPLLRAVRAANETVNRASSDDPARRGMGCTLAAIHLSEGLAAYVSVGDSRIYLLRSGRLIQVSEDHTRLRMLGKSGIQLDPAEANQLKGILTRAVGIQPAVDVDYGTSASVEGDVWLLCSDGLTDELDDDRIRGILLGTPDAREAAVECVNRAVAAGGRDNVTVVVARVLSSRLRTAEDPPAVVTAASDGAAASTGARRDGILKRISRRILGDRED